MFGNLLKAELVDQHPWRVFQRRPVRGQQTTVKNSCLNLCPLREQCENVAIFVPAFV